MKLFRSLSALLFTIVLACGPSQSTTDRPHDFNTVYGWELEATNATNLYDAISILRPGMLIGRGPRDKIVVVSNGMVLGGIDQLTTFTASGIKAVHRMSAADATFLYGSRIPSATTLDVITKPE